MTCRPVPHPKRWNSVGSGRHRSPHLLTDSPDEAGKFPSERSDDDGRLLATRDHRSIADPEAGLCLPGDVPNVLRQSDEDLGLLLRDASWIAIAPCSFDQHPPCFPVAGLGDAAATNASAAGMFRWHKAEVAHQHPWRLKAAQIASRADERGCRQQVDPTQAAQRFDERSERPTRRHRTNPFDQCISSLLCRPDRLNIILEYDPMNLLLKGLTCHSGSMALRPMLAGRIRATMSQKEGEQLLPSPHQVHGCIHSRADQIAQRFMRRVRHPHPGQVSGSVQDRQLLPIAPIGLDPLPWLAWNERSRGNCATVAQRCELAIDVLPATASLIAEVELAMLGKPLGHLRDVVRLVRDDANEPHWAVPPVFGYRDQ